MQLASVGLGLRRNPLYVRLNLACFHLGDSLVHEGDDKGAMEAFEDALVSIRQTFLWLCRTWSWGRRITSLGSNNVRRKR